MKSRLCKLCGAEFIPKSSRQLYCNKEIIRVCKTCGSEFKSTCNPSSPQYCSNKCAGAAANNTVKICEICGTEFTPNSPRQKYCRRIITKRCIICGAVFELHCGDDVNTCSEKCSQAYAHIRSVESNMSTVRICQWCGEEFHPVNNTQKFCNRPHYSTCEICGVRYPVDLSKQDVSKTCSPTCANQLRFIDGNPFSKPEVRLKAKNTMMLNYGCDHPMKSTDIVDKMFKTYKEKTGYDHPMNNPSVRSKMVKSGKQSSFEIRVRNLFDQYNIEHIDHYFLSQDNISHEFDFYLPKYKFLIDCDGVYYHSYLDDPDGKHVLDYYDEDRIALIPKDHIFHVIVEGQEERDIKYIVDIIRKMDSNVFDYEGELFSWCRSVGFPYPKYDHVRMEKDYNKLVDYQTSKYISSCRLGSSIINNYHHSIYDAHVKNYPSPKQAWDDDTLLKRVIANRLIYKNDVDPYKIMKGFNISKICPRVSVFNPVLAKYIYQKYMSEFSEVFDPFSGFSGRLLGITASNVHYIGQDKNKQVVEESNQIISDFNLQNCEIKCKDILNDSGSYQCLITCPPYYNKEIYSDESVFKTCDDWIDFILDRYKCQRYAFVVDFSDKYSDKIVEEIKSTSHFNKTTEYLLVM